MTFFDRGLEQTDFRVELEPADHHLMASGQTILGPEVEASDLLEAERLAREAPSLLVWPDMPMGDVERVAAPSGGLQAMATAA